MTSLAIAKFRKLLRRAIFVTQNESDLFDAIPDAIFEGIYRHNFNGDAGLAERILLNRYSEIDRTDRQALEQHKLKIDGLGRASEKIAAALEQGRPVLFITDSDNDGSLAQAILIEFNKTLPKALRKLVHVEYTQPIGRVRGITSEIVEKAWEARGWGSDESVLIVTADNGINNAGEVATILADHNQSEVIITDHHLPNADVVPDGARSMVFNPKHRPTEYFKHKNISGANTLGVLLKATFHRLVENAKTQGNDLVSMGAGERQALNNIDEIGSWANLLDYANSDIADMPVRPYIVEKAMHLRPLLNVSNSMSNLVTGTFSSEQLKAISQASMGTGNGVALTQDWLAEKIETVHLINRVAQRLLSMHRKYGDQQNAYNKSDFYQLLSEELTRPAEAFPDGINPNYIEQMRPVIFNAAAIDDKDIFLALLAETMTGTFEDLRQVEREIIEGLRGCGLLKSDKLAHSTILYPVDDSVVQVFNRRLLGKAYNEDNNGFLLILSDIGGPQAKGSMRSLYPISRLLSDKKSIENELGIEVDFQGHEQAAGFFIRTHDGRDLDSQTLSAFNRWMDRRVGELKVDEKINQIATVEVDFASSGLIERINRAVKANLAGMRGVPAILRLSSDRGVERGRGVWITDNQTTEQIDIGELIQKKSFGYQAVKTDFHDGAVVLPVEMLRSVADSHYRKALRLSYLDEGVFLASQVVDPDQLSNLVPIKGGRKDQLELAAYYDRTFGESHFMALTRDDFRRSPYFLFNKHGDGEFEMFEALVLGLLDASEADVMAVIDTEGTGLGKAPKCFNIGGTHLMADPASGSRMPIEAFQEGYFRNATGSEFLLSPEQIGSLVAIDEDEEAEAGSVILFKASIRGGVAWNERVAFPGQASELLKLTNMKPEGHEVVFNRSLHGTAWSYLVNNNDFAITQELENLTGISNGMLEGRGLPAARVDRELEHFFDNLKTADGRPAKIIFQAHNMPYDRGVILANFQKLGQVMDRHLTSDTAKIARSAKLAYDDTPVSSFLKIDGIPNVYFYDSPYSDYSLSTFLARAARGKGGVFPDTKSKILLRYNPETERFSVIDRKANREVLIDTTVENLLENRRAGQLPNNEIRYSVERMSLRAMIRNILLLDKSTPHKVALNDKEKPFRAALELFQEKYHFDITPERNIKHFLGSLSATDEKNTQLAQNVDMVLLTRRFLEANKATQAKFHDGWIYEKVLDIYEPNAGTQRVPKEIVEEINYFTDVPSSKIRKALADVIRFQRQFGIDHALVHEQHNNIRQRSDNGQGLSDTAYECILPQSLAMMKFFNPYYQSVQPAVAQLLESNIRGSMIQTMLNDGSAHETASDSFSMRQMMAFRRQNPTQRVRAAQKLAKTGEAHGGGLAVLKFKLPAGVLPPGTGIYAQPKAFVAQDQILEDSKMLCFVVLNEQIKNTTLKSGDHGDRVNLLAAANDAKAIAYRDELLTRYERIDFSRKETCVKRISEMVHDAYEGHPVQAKPKSIEFDEDTLSTGLGLIQSFGEVYRKTGKKTVYSTVDELETAMKNWHEAFLTGRADAADDPQASAFDVSSVRQAHFLPELNISRQEPLRFALETIGSTFCSAFLKQAEAVPGVSGRRSPSP